MVQYKVHSIYGIVRHLGHNYCLISCLSPLPYFLCHFLPVSFLALIPVLLPASLIVLFPVSLANFHLLIVCLISCLTLCLTPTHFLPLLLACFLSHSNFFPFSL